MLWVFICTVHLTICYYHVTYVFQSESSLYSCLNVKELLARNRRDIWSLSNSNGIRTHNHLVRKRTLNHLAKLAKWLSCVVIIYLYGAFDCMLSSCHVQIRVPLLSLKLQIFEQEVPWHSGNYRMQYHSETRTWHDNNIQSNTICSVNNINQEVQLGMFVENEHS